MKNFRNNEVADRRSSAADAKASLINAYRAAKTASEPSRLARQAERALLVEARELRRAERNRLNLEEQSRTAAMAAAEQAAADAAVIAETEARNAAENARIARVVEDEAARKADRDRRYAARKSRLA